MAQVMLEGQGHFWVLYAQMNAQWSCLVASGSTHLAWVLPGVPVQVWPLLGHVLVQKEAVWPGRDMHLRPGLHPG